MEQFNQLDLLIALALTAGAINGFFKGFISQLIGLFGFFIAIWASFKFYQFIEVFVNEQNIVADGLTSIVAVLLTFGIAYFGIRLFSRLVQKSVEMAGLGFFNRLAGAALGVVLLLLLSSSLLFYADPILELSFKETKDGSQLLPYLSESAEYVKNMFYETKNTLREEASNITQSI